MNFKEFLTLDLSEIGKKKKETPTPKGNLLGEPQDNGKKVEFQEEKRNRKSGFGKTVERGVLLTDTINNAFSILPIAEKTFDKITFEGEEDLFTRGEFGKALERAFDGLDINQRLPMECDVVLPHQTYGIDYITLPSMKKSAFNDAIRSEVKTMYKNYENLCIARQLISQNKNNTTYRLLIARKEVLDGYRNAFKTIGVEVGDFLPEGCCRLSGIMAQESRIKHSDCVVAFPEQNKTSILIFAKDTIAGVFTLPYGEEILNDNKTADEITYYDNSVAELAVLNAKEKAKTLKLTSYFLEEEAMGNTSLSNNELSTQNSGDGTEQGEETEKQTIQLSNEETGEQTGEEDEEEEQEESPEEPEIPTLLPNGEKIKTTKKKLRRLPKYMLRPIPETPEGFIIENFRPIEKRILLLLRECGTREYLPPIENIWLCMPDKYDFLTKSLSEEQENTYNWHFITPKEDVILEGCKAYNATKFPIL